MGSNGVNGQSVFDVFGNGYRRTVIDTNGKGTVGVSIPQELAESMAIEIGDDVVVYESDKDGVLELHFGSE
ncbi:AbrB/MazE/SpoVT family DNA-binding domain-containing protein [Haloplanus rallus]|uniref:AbrB/MazE/SpoVT family DNA-binding domain-containing protein n=1 Tax=Haloplanus rallus TaxID=1816183 RepID=A0A6B9FH65_9EURY|nr:AbrB/MazE/SpoVT family DNA-binding domain-containing protein [Haloplanus rallus]QGX95923.1 AbrB/MazE/SpoVT family DNA-binding domain-containing protein [Haloplanus rallus]